MEKKDSKKYQDMLNEVEGIITRIADEKTDLDQLVLHVEQGYDLLKQMQSRLTEVKGQVERLHLENDSKG